MQLPDKLEVFTYRDSLPWGLIIGLVRIGLSVASGVVFKFFSEMVTIFVSVPNIFETIAEMLGVLTSCVLSPGVGRELPQLKFISEYPIEVVVRRYNDPTGCPPRGQWSGGHSGRSRVPAWWSAASRPNSP